MDAVACRVDQKIDDVPRLLTAEDGAAREHQLEDVFVADLRPSERHAVLAQLLFEAEVGHDGRDDGVAAKLSLAMKTLGPEVDDLVAVAHLSFVIDEDRAIRI